MNERQLKKMNKDALVARCIQLATDEYDARQKVYCLERERNDLKKEVENLQAAVSGAQTAFRDIRMSIKAAAAMKYPDRVFIMPLGRQTQMRVDNGCDWVEPSHRRAVAVESESLPEEFLLLQHIFRLAE